jgi:hypothetical protein
MKRYIIITAMLVFTLGLNAQRTTGSRTGSATTKSEDEKKASPAATETRTREATQERSNSSNESRQQTPVVRQSSGNESQQSAPARTAPIERKTEPAYNESRNRETPPVRQTTTTKASQTPAVENRSSERNENRTVAPQRSGEQERPGSGTQDPQRKTGGTSTQSRATDNRNTTTAQPGNSVRTQGNREVSTDRNREYTPRTEPVYAEKRQAYRTPERPRTVRTVNHQTNYVNHPVEYRRTYYPYTEPRRVEIIWDYNMYNEYRYLYPQYDYWYYPYGYRILTVSAYDADRFIGEIARIYGKVSEVWYERQTDEYTLYIGGPYPFQDLSVVIAGKYARRYSYHPERYFTNRNIAVTGLVSLWDERPEMIVRKRSQLETYF